MNFEQIFRREAQTEAELGKLSNKLISDFQKKLNESIRTKSKVLNGKVKH